MNTFRTRSPICGDIGEPVKHIELEPFPETAPSEPAIAPVTAPDREEIPA